MYSLIFLKLKNKRNSNKKYVDLVQIKNSFAHFWKIKVNIKKKTKISAKSLHPNVQGALEEDCLNSRKPVQATTRSIF